MCFVEVCQKRLSVDVPCLVAKLQGRMQVSPTCFEQESRLVLFPGRVKLSQAGITAVQVSLR